jgi:hypothetical protein
MSDVKDVEKLAISIPEDAPSSKKETDVESQVSVPIGNHPNGSSGYLSVKEDTETPRGEPIHRAVTAQDWIGPDDPENPHNWSVTKKAIHTIFPGLYGFAV